VNTSITNSFSLKKYENLFNIVETSIKKIQSIRDDKLKEYLLSYMAHQYNVLISGLSRLDKASRKRYYDKLLLYKWLWDYDLNPKVKKVKLLASILGISITSYILAIYIDRKTNR
jgi:hypothetical protein